MRTGFWRFIDALQDGVMDLFHNWRRSHLMAAPFGILLTTLYLWQLADPEQQNIEYAASLVDLGALIYGTTISGMEVLIGMFYAIAKHLEYKDKLRKEGREEGRKEERAAVLAKLDGIISAEQIAELRARLDQEENGAAH
jgi:hypothetical protein